MSKLIFPFIEVILFNQRKSCIINWKIWIKRLTHFRCISGFYSSNASLWSWVNEFLHIHGASGRIWSSALTASGRFLFAHSFTIHSTTVCLIVGNFIIVWSALCVQLRLLILIFYEVKCLHIAKHKNSIMLCINEGVCVYAKPLQLPRPSQFTTLSSDFSSGCLQVGFTLIG